MLVNVFKFFHKNLLLQVLVSLLTGAFLAHYVPIYVVEFFYSLSYIIKEILVFLLPFIIFSYLVSSLTEYQNKASKFIFIVFVCVLVSIFTAMLFAYFASITFLPSIIDSNISSDFSTTEVIRQKWSLGLKNIPTDVAMVFSIFFALWLNFLRSSFICRFRNNFYNKMEWQKRSTKEFIFSTIFSLGIFSSEQFLDGIKNIVLKMKKYSEIFLLNVFVPLVPIYVFGFMLKLSIESASVEFFIDFGQIFIFNLFCIIVFIFISYFLISNFSIKKTFSNMKNMLPATLTGFSTMSSVATMPLTMQGVEKNLEGDETFAKFVIPTTVNVHAIGDVINISICGLALLLMSSHIIPSFHTYLIFVFYTCIAQFSCVAVPGGGIIVMTGILSKYLGLDADSILLLTSIYFILEPFLTSANVTYNGSFTMLLHRFLIRKTD